MIKIQRKIKLKPILIILGSLIINGCGVGGNKNISPENAMDKRIEIFPEENNIKYEKSWHYESPTAANSVSWSSTDTTQLSFYPDNMEIKGAFSSKRIINTNAESNKLDDFVLVPVVKNKVAYVKNNNAVVSAYNIETGKKIWSQYLSEDKKKFIFIGGGLFEHDGIIYCSFGGNEIIALEAETGDEIWRAKLSSIVRATPTYGYGKLFVKSLDNRFFVLNAKNGNLLHVMDTGVESLVRASKATAVLHERGTILVSNSSGIISLIKESDGESVWSANIAFYDNPIKSLIMNDISMTPIIRRNTVYAASQIGNLIAMDVNTGDLKWNHIINGIESLWITGSGLFTIDDSNNLWHINAYSGLARWKVSLSDLSVKHRKGGRFYGPTMINGHLFVSTSFGALLEISPQNGKLVKTYDIPSDRSSIPIVIDKEILILSASGKLTILSFK